MTGRRHAAEVLDLLLAERPLLHGGTGREVNWSLGDELLRWLVAAVPPGGRTLETGCGYSTIVFAALSDEHTVISPSAEEHERILEWCGAHDIRTGHLRFEEAPSERYLPGLPPGRPELDVVLIDGDHCFPIPAIDWFYAAPLLRVGGVCVIDDVSIRACGELADFLAAEAGRWDRVVDLDGAQAYRRLDLEIHGSEGRWRAQPWNSSTDRQGSMATVRAAVHRIRRAPRLRSRLGLPRRD